MRKSLAVCVMTAAMLAGGFGPGADAARADIPVKSLYIGLHGGIRLPLDDVDFGELRQNRPELGGLIGARVGFHITWWMAAEIGFMVNPFGDSSDGSNLGLSISGDLLFHLIKGDWVPVLDVGAGADIITSGDLGTDADYNLHWGLGVRGMVLDWLAFRVDARHVLGDPVEVDTIFSNSLELTVGLDFYAWVEDHTPPDTDKDGVLDPDDKCVKEPGTAATGGCPDSDGDGVIDSQDKCPTKAGKADLGGCPDTDDDGVADASDSCPAVAGKAEFKGCPDSDGDGIPDPDDKCPMAKGLAKFQGCPPPDKDKDGIPDSQDECPDQAGSKAHKGCPDTDRDGIRDKDDKCPKIPGVKEEQGCLPKAVSKFTGAIKGIRFKSGSAKILKKSFRTLKAAAKVLKKWPAVRLRVEGHTDDRGADASNLKLSQARAEAVVAWFVGQGIDKGRLVAKGYGETKPIASNKKSSGRAKNRRIEFTVLGQN